MAIQRSKVKDIDFAWFLIICCNFGKEKLNAAYIIAFTVSEQGITKAGSS